MPQKKKPPTRRKPELKPKPRHRSGMPLWVREILEDRLNTEVNKLTTDLNARTYAITDRVDATMKSWRAEVKELAETVNVHDINARLNRLHADIIAERNATDHRFPNLATIEKRVEALEHAMRSITVKVRQMSGGNDEGSDRNVSDANGGTAPRSGA